MGHQAAFVFSSASVALISPPPPPPIFFSGHPAVSKTGHVDSASAGDVDTDPDGGLATTAQPYYAHRSSANSAEPASDR